MRSAFIAHTCSNTTGVYIKHCDRSSTLMTGQASVERQLRPAALLGRLRCCHQWTDKFMQRGLEMLAAHRCSCSRAVQHPRTHPTLLTRSRISQQDSPHLRE